MSDIKFNPEYSVSVWSILSELMEERALSTEMVAALMTEDMAAEDFADRVGVNLLTLQLMEVTADEPDALLGQSTAEALERAIGLSATFWLNVAEKHRAWLLAGRVPSDKEG